MATIETKSDKDKLAQPEKTNYGSEREETTKSLEEVYSIVGVGRAQHVFWAVLAVTSFFDTAEMVVISTIVPILRCEWELDIWWETMINVSGYFFSALGGAVFAKLPDIYGRKRVLWITLILLFLATSASAIAQTKTQYLIMRIAVGLCMGLPFSICITFSSEVVKSSHREIGPTLILLLGNLSAFLSAVFAYLGLKRLGWRWFVFLNALPLLVCVILLLSLPESPRYLVVSNKKKEANEAIQRMARLNGVTLPENLNVVVHSDQELGSVSDISKSDYRKETILMSMMYFGNLLILFGTTVFVPLALYSGFCGGQGHLPVHECAEIKQESLLQLSVVTFGDVLAVVAGYIGAMKLGRSISLKIVSTGSFIVTLFLFKCFTQAATVGLFFLIKFLQDAHNMITLIMIPDVYPTVFRNTAMGFINSWGKLGGVVGAGAVYALYYYSPILVVTMFSASALLVAISSWIWNKETKEAMIMDLRENTDGGNLSDE